MQKAFSSLTPTRLACWILALGTFVLYAPTLFFQFLYYDDNEYVFENLHIRGGLTLDFLQWFWNARVSANWHPLTLLSHALDAQIYGMWAGGHHLTSVLFHIANALLVFILFHRITQSAGKSFLLAAIFAWHPVKVESVAWIAERKDVLSTFFALLSMLAYEQSSRPETQGPKKKWLLSLTCFALSLMSKPMYVSLPIILLLFDFWPLQRKDKNFFGLLVEKVPFIVLSAVSCLIALKYQSEGGAIKNFTHLPLAVHVANIAQAYWDYIFLFLLPAKLSIFYPYTPNSHVSLSLLIALFFSAVTGLLFWKRNIVPALWVGWCLFLVCLLPVIGIVKLGSHWIACRYLYWPSIGLSFILIWGCGAIIQKLTSLRKLFLIGAAILLVVWSIATARYLEKWQNSYVLFTHAKKTVPENWIAHINLRAAYGRDGNHEKAAEHYLEAIKIFPDVLEKIEPHWLDFYYMGKINWKRGQIPQAESFFKEAARLIAATPPKKLHPDTSDERKVLASCLAAIQSNQPQSCAF